jgi:hypothetical protein
MILQAGYVANTTRSCAKKAASFGFTINNDGTVTERRVAGERTVILEPDVYEYFPNSQAVNHALRTLICLYRKSAGPLPRQREVSSKRKSSVPTCV